MEETHNNRTSLVRGAKDIAKEAKRQAAKNFSKAVDRASDEYSSQRSYNRFQNEDEEENNYNSYTQQDGLYADNATNEEDGASSDATEGHDDEDEIYEGEYQGVPGYNDGKPRDGQVALGQPVSDSLKSCKELENERQADEEELAQQYELIMQECGHGRFQWQLFFVLGLALMSDGVEVFVVGFVLPSAETDMCVPNSGAGWLGKVFFFEKDVILRKILHFWYYSLNGFDVQRVFLGLQRSLHFLQKLPCRVRILLFHHWYHPTINEEHEKELPQNGDTQIKYM